MIDKVIDGWCQVIVLLIINSTEAINRIMVFMHILTVFCSKKDFNTDITNNLLPRKIKY
jgi:hypothetical protein